MEGFFRYTKALEIVGWASEIHRLIICREIIKETFNQ
tara:strand:- start:289 stop:399 length:111 start_codon:yes stop_codon:yes gene_type:complete